MKTNETHPGEKGFVLWGHCQNILDDPRSFILSRFKNIGFWHLKPLKGEVRFDALSFTLTER